MKFYLLCGLLAAVSLTAACHINQSAAAEVYAADSVAETTTEPTLMITENVSMPPVDTRLQAEFLSPRIIGSSRVFCGAVLLSDIDVDEAGFLLHKEDGAIVYEIAAENFENTYYVQMDALSQDTCYILKMYYIIGDKKEYVQNELVLTTPKKVLSEEQVNDILRKSMKGDIFEPGTQRAFVADTQSALTLLDIPCGYLGIKNYNLQLNQIKLEYSFNSYGRYTNWEMIDGKYDEDTTAILKDIISVNEVPEYSDFFCLFVPTPHVLFEYNKYDEEGGQFDAEQYLYDNLKNDEEVYLSYAEYPFIYESAEFQQKYIKLIEENKFNDELSEDLNYTIAYNKFLFSYYNRPYMDKYAVPQDRVIKINYGGELTIRTAVAFSYLVTEIPPDFGRLYINNSWREYNDQAHVYTRGMGMTKAVDREPCWHLDRQSSSYVPGFSNHQYAIAIDFNAIQTFRSNPLYGYLQENAERYGFYNYYKEPWHWVYLGE